MDIWKEIKSTYKKAYNQIQTEKPYQHQQLYKSFASSVAMLCHDNPLLPLNKRCYYLVKLLHLSGGPTIREHACIHSAFAIGDAVENRENAITSYELDERFPLPGTWDYEKAYNFCLTPVFGEITSLHLKVWLQETCCDDTPEDIKQVKKLLENISELNL
ncbi:MAG: hypothetical protein GW795_06815 [Cyanobacteria bacterium]|nr:hypothetical protein [Cyanobacteria bacterium CG_2015-16_32_12]NCO78749.1 hypothetical protein [Cyanobacteria bacterium CG_2015-22_32_23]NCQ03135.1 hypothetical protein [Cyanobacteria bacterium CG_2015-09_32_10]NCQ41593.1 hypothetical protein [Cyanobacteria bacterium CG_2015-04_32_10]NCS83618.1 hypothetical protein [Cyanobacteria bacterium CG_2015-02_32_10]